GRVGRRSSPSRPSRSDRARSPPISSSRTSAWLRLPFGSAGGARAGGRGGEKIQDEAIDLGGSLLLREVAGVRQDAQLRAGNRLLKPPGIRYRQHVVLRAPDDQSRLAKAR